MAVEAPSGIVKWYSHNLVGPRILATLKGQLTGVKQPGGFSATSYVKLSEKEADELIENIKNDPKGFPNFDEDNAPDKREEYQRWLVARYHTKVKEEAFNDTQKASSAPKPTSSALVPVGTKGTDLVEEQIDERVLAILGLQDAFDFTYEEYLTLLKEKAVSARMTQQGMSTESVELITDEFKRVKGKTGKFKVKAKKVNINKVVNRTGQAAKTSVQLDPTKLLPPAISDSQEEQQEVQKDILDFLKNDLLDALKSINSVVTDILDVLKEQRAIDKKKAEQDRKNAEVEKKKKRESKLEGDTGKRMSSLVSTIAKPFTSFFDTIKNFFMNILMGSAINFLLAVIKDPSIILTPLKNFANMVIGFLNSIISFLWNLVVSPINFVINGINSGIQGLINQINNAIRLIPGGRPIAAPQIPTVPGPPQIPTFPVQQQEGGGETIKIGDISLMSGGGVDNKTGMKVSGFGKDTQLTALSPGEVVFSNPAADFWGRDNLLAMNAIGGGTNKPKFGALGSVQTMAGGGMVDGGMVDGGMVDGEHGPINYLKKINQSLSLGTIGGNTSNNTNNTFLNLIRGSVSSTTSGQPSSKGSVSSTTSGQPSSKGSVSSTTSGQPSSKGSVSSTTSGQSSSNGSVATSSPTKLDVIPPEGRMVTRLGILYYQKPDSIGTLTHPSAAPASIRMQSPINLDKSITNINLQSTKQATNIQPPTSSQPRVAMLPVPVGGGQQAPTSSATSSQPDIPGFSPEDPMNMSTLVVKAIYNMVG